MNGRFADLTGKTFNRWTVLAYAERRGHHLYWRCRCICGTEATIYGGNLTRGLSKSCGCWNSQVTAERNRRNKRHGGCGTPEYEVWHTMRVRCKNPNDPNYGGRGITVCKEWDSFAQFLADVGPRPSPAHSLDRYPDNNGNYEPGNVRWALHEEQDRNKRTNRLLTYNGETLCATAWAKRLGILMPTLFTRLRKGWPVEKVLAVK